MIYLVDDEPFMHHFLGQELRRAGHTLVVIRGPNEAYVHLMEEAAEPDDIVLIDMMMPAGFRVPGHPDFAGQSGYRSGLRLAEELLKADHARFVGRLAIYSDAPEPDAETQDWLNANGIPFLNKFTTMDGIVETIETMIASVASDKPAT